MTSTAKPPPKPARPPIKNWKGELPIEPTPPVRAKGEKGTIGTNIRLKANYYEVQVQDWNKKLVHYDVVIKQPGKEETDLTISKTKKLEIFEAFKNKNPEFFSRYKIGYDGMKSAVSVGVIPQLKDGAVYKVSLATGGRKPLNYQVIFKVVNKRSLSELNTFLQSSQHGVRKDAPATVFQLIEIMFRYTPLAEFISVGQNSFFSKDNRDPFSEVTSISGDKIAQRGFFASLRPAAWKNASLLLNVDVAHVTFYKEQSLLCFMKENEVISSEDYRNENLNRTLGEKQRKWLLTKLKGLKVRVSHSLFPRNYKVIDVMEVGANRQMFKEDDGSLKSVENYFKEKYPSKRLHYPKLNVIRAAPDSKTVYLPIEFCDIAKGQKVKRQRVSPKELSNFISFTARPPQKRLNSINEIPRNKKLTENELMKDLGFSFSDKPIELTGRVLPAPRLQLNASSVVVPVQGQWNIKDKKFFQSKNIEFWAVLNYSDRLTEYLMSEFVKQIISTGSNTWNKSNIHCLRTVKIFLLTWINVYPGKEGYSNSPRTSAPWATGSHSLAVDAQSEYASSPKRDTQSAAFDQFRKEIMSNIKDALAKNSTPVKKYGDRMIHVPTQCVLSENVSKPKPATIGNLLFKMNAKMGGINNTLPRQGSRFILDRPVMIMGADVNHAPASDKSGTPSIAAVVGSLDKFASRYAVEVCPQTSRKEMIENMKEMTKSLLKSFFYATRFKPERIIMYRDGVSESQFLEVLAYELRAMREACTALEEGYEPGITFIVVQKRHHTRFFPVNEREGVGRCKNVPPGTVVDTEVTHPTDIDFFLCSHEGIQGTSKPTHYRILWDDNDLSLNQLETFSYAMCHLYARCARSVSIPTPAYYAHWAAYRGKTHLHDLCQEGNKTPSERELLEAVKMDMNNEINRKMYFL
ncbi:protein argonaute-2-like [Macrobrachium rosenbergii]|uniref:protein argonaute-2-like n=1 Tax=Macrobrachium rosenbergii TaxID=79674 RepID=UPI0034D5E805